VIATLTTSEYLTVASILLGGGFIGAMVAVYKAKPERDSVVVSSAQNAAEILKGEVLLRQNGIPIPQDEPRTQAQA
jgi:hypothetical protein